jgi:Phospholipase B
MEAMRRLLLCLLFALSAAGLTPEQQQWISRAKREPRDGWIYLHVEGAPRERGFQHGYLLAKEIDDGLRMRRKEWEYFDAMEWSWLTSKTKTLVIPKVDPELLAEIDGIAEGMNAAGVAVTREDLVAYNDWFDLEGSWFPTVKKDVGSRASSLPKQSCSAFIATGRMTSDGGIVLGHNTWFEFPAATANVMLDMKPAKGHHFIMQIYPGWVHSGTDWFVTDAGLVGAETTIGNFAGFDVKGVPEFDRMRRATQYADTIDDWCAIMRKGNNGGYANAWLIGDVNTNEIARLELGLQHVAFERTKDGYFTGSNVAENQKILRFETDEQETDIRISGVARRVRWKQLMRENAGRIDVEKGKAFEADHYDAYLKKELAGARSLCGHFDENQGLHGTAPPYTPAGSFDAKVIDTKLAKRMAFAARWGRACGEPFDAKKFIDEHPQFDWMRDILPSRPSQPWTEIKAGM